MAAQDKAVIKADLDPSGVAKGSREAENVISALGRSVGAKLGGPFKDLGATIKGFGGPLLAFGAQAARATGLIQDVDLSSAIKQYQNLDSISAKLGAQAGRAGTV